MPDNDSRLWSYAVMEKTTIVAVELRCKLRGKKMADWMCLGYKDDLTFTPKERMNLSATSSATTLKERVLLRGHQDVSFNSVFKTQLTQERCARCFRELSIFLSMSKCSVVSST